MFNPEKIASYGAKDVERLMKNEGIVRNRAKIEATIANAKSYLDLRERTTLRNFLWDFLDDGPVANTFRTISEVPAQTDLSRRIAKALKAEGFRFVGPTTAYAFMQSVGMVNDHLLSCHRYDECAKLQRTNAAR